MRALERPRPVGRRLVEGRLSGVPVGVLTTGVGPRRAAARCDRALADWPATGVVNLGTCGALDDALEIGEVVRVGRVLDEDGLDAPLDASGPPRPTLITVRRGVWDPRTRADLALRGARICDMEAAAILGCCRARGLPLVVVKVVSDHAGAGLDRRAPAPGGRPGPRELARFMARAWRLVSFRLVPLLPALIQGVTR